MLDSESFRICLDSAMEGFKANLVELHELALQRSFQWAEDAVHAARTEALQEVCELRLENDRLRECLSAATSLASAPSKSSVLVKPETWNRLTLDVAQTEEDKERALLAAGAKVLVSAVVQRALRGLSSPSLKLPASAHPAALCPAKAQLRKPRFSPPPRAPGSPPGSTPDIRMTSPCSTSGSISEEAARRAKALGFLEGWHARVDLEGSRMARGDVESHPGRQTHPDQEASSATSPELAGDSWTLKSASETALATASETAFGFLESLGVADSLSDSWKAWGFQVNDKQDSQRRSSEPALLGSFSREDSGATISRSHSVGYCEESALTLRAEVLGSPASRRRKHAKGSGKPAERVQQHQPLEEATPGAADSGSHEQAGKKVRFSSEVEIHPIRRWQAAAHTVTQHRRAAAAAASASSASSSSFVGVSLMDLLTATAQAPTDVPEQAHEDQDDSGL